MSNKDIIKTNLTDSINLKTQLLEDETVIQVIDEICQIIIKTFKNKSKILFCGNGGSAADAQHLAAEFSGRYYLDRNPLNAEALHTNSSFMTAVANDYSFDQVYARMIKAMGKQGDILIGLSTSGNSKNIVNAFKQAKQLKLITIGLTGKDGGIMKDYCDYIIKIPSKDTPRIQECHLLIGHAICQIVEKELFPKAQ